jgi:2-desacetyl-2-hydroxyethyl bacteriochlorophyllide A dehydrogenase
MGLNMRALVYTAPQTLEIQELPRPVLKAGEVEISVEYAGICGSDMTGFLGHSPRRKPPLVLGHELVGRLGNGQRVVANPLISCGHCAACVSGFQNLCDSWRLLGMDRTQGTYADFVSLPKTQLISIPEEIPATRAILAEPLANVVHLFRLAAAPPFFRLAIVGAGTMGALTLLMAKCIGAREILVADVNAERLEVMQQLGADRTANVSAAEGSNSAVVGNPAGFDLVVDASGAASARQLAFDLCRPGGQVLLLGMGSQRSEVDFVASIRKEHRVTMSFAYTPIDFQQSVHLLLGGEIDLTSLTEQAQLEAGQRAFERMTTSPGATLKMMLSLT